MEGAQILIAGVGGLGCSWASKAHLRVNADVDLVLIDADESSFELSKQAHVIKLGAESNANGCAGLPPLGEQRMRNLSKASMMLLKDVELVILLLGLGGGTGTGAGMEFARQAKRSGSVVITLAAEPFESQKARREIANEGLLELERMSDICVRLSLDRLAWQARERGSDWTMGALWVEEFVEGLVRTLMKMGLINLDMMDLKAIVSKDGKSTLLVAQGDANEPDILFENAMRAPLAEIDIFGATGCLLQIEGGLGMTVSQVSQVADIFTSRLDQNAQVILGARISEDLHTTLRVVAVVSGKETD